MSIMVVRRYVSDPERDRAAPGLGAGGGRESPLTPLAAGGRCVGATALGGIIRTWRVPCPRLKQLKTLKEGQAQEARGGRSKTEGRRLRSPCPRQASP